MENADLHIHTTASDGEHTPEEIVDMALEKGLDAIAICDHETVLGSQKAIAYAKDTPLEVVGGIEIVCDDPDLGIFDVDVLGLFIDVTHPQISCISSEIKILQKKNKKKIIDRLNELGFDVSLDELETISSGAYYWRGYLAKILYEKYPQTFSSVQEAFETYLGITSKEYVLQSEYTFKECIKRIQEAGGVAILAHPGRLKKRATKVIEAFLKSGGDGIEVYYNYSCLSDFSKQDEQRLIKKFLGIAKKKNILYSGGTDFHNKRDSSSIGTYGLSKEAFIRFKRKLMHRQ